MVWFPIPCLRGSHFPKILIPSSVVLMTPAVKESVCQWCGARIYLIRVSINNWEWATDVKRPRATWKCDADAEWPAARSHRPVLLDGDADDSSAK